MLSGQTPLLKHFGARLTPAGPLFISRSTDAPKGEVVPIRVLLQPRFFLSETWNGMDEHLLTLSRHLDRREFELILCVADSDGPQTLELARRAELDTVPVDGSKRSLPSEWAAWRRVYGRVRPDLIHMHTPTVGGQAGCLLAARSSGAPTLMTVHQYQPWKLPLRSRWLNRLAQHGLIGATVAVSEDVRRSLRIESGFAAAAIRTIANGIDEPRPRPQLLPRRRPGDPVRIGFFGRLSFEKGVDHLLRAMRDVRPAAHLYIIGDGPERMSLLSLASSLGIEERVTFLGFVEHAAGLMRELDVVAHTPRYEGFGLVILEAMACGRPVVVSAAPGGMGEMVVHGKTGLIAADNSPSAIAHVLERLVGDAPIRSAMGLAGRQRWRDHYRAELMVQQVAGLYRELADSSGARLGWMDSARSKTRRSPGCDMRSTDGT